MKRNLVPLLGIAFVVAIISTGIFYGLFVGRMRASNSAPVRSIAVAAKNLDRGATLQETDAKLIPWSAAELPPGAFGAVNEVTGLTLIGAIQENEPILRSRVASKDSGGGIGIASGMRAVSIHAVDSSGVVSILRPGHKVDVQLVAGQGSQPELRTILQNIEVMSVNEKGDGRPVITLLMSPPQADLAGLGDSSARLRIMLRNPLDTGSSDLDPVNLPAILKSRSLAKK